MVHDWVGAEKAYKKASASTNNLFSKSMTNNSLCALYGLLGRDNEALGAARESTKLARQDGSSVWTSSALGVEASLCLRANNLETASTLIEEIFRSIGGGPMDDLSRARALVLRANYYQKRSDMPKAEADLATAWKILQPHDEVRVLAGWHVALAAWWATTARVRAKQSDLAGAVAAWREAVNRYRRVAEARQIEGPYKFNSVAVALNDLGQALQAAGETEGAEQAFRESRSLRRAIGVPPLDASGSPR
jgi:hypothetical protein